MCYHSFCLPVHSWTALLAYAERFHARTCCQPRCCKGSNDTARRGDDAKAWVALHGECHHHLLQNCRENSGCFSLQRKTQRSRKGHNWKEVRPRQAHEKRQLCTRVIRRRRRAPQLKQVCYSVELVRDYCSLYPALNLSCCSGSAASCLRLFEVGKSSSHVLLMHSLSVCLLFCLCSAGSPQHRHRDLEELSSFALHPQILKPVFGGAEEQDADCCHVARFTSARFRKKKVWE